MPHVIVKLWPWKRKAEALRLKSIKRFPGGVLWMRYLVKNQWVNGDYSV